MNTRHRAASRAKRKLATSTYAADPNSLVRVLEKLVPLNQAERIDLELPMLLAYQKLCTGAATHDEFDELATRLNITMVLCEEIDDPLPVQTVQLALDAMARTLARHHKLNSWGFDATALQHIPAAIDLHKQLIELCTPLQISTAARECQRRMVNGDVLNPTQATA